LGCGPVVFVGPAQAYLVGTGRNRQCARRLHPEVRKTDLAGEALTGSREAVVIRRAAVAPDPEAVQAAADLGAYVLSTVATGLDEGWSLHQKWSGRLDEVRYVPPPVDQADQGWIDVR